MRYCSFCKEEHFEPIIGQSCQDWYWQSNKTKVGGTHVCRINKRVVSYNWEKSNPEKAKAKHSSNRTKRRSTSHGRLRHSFSSLMSSRLSGKSNQSVFSLVGYTLDDLKRHLESKFQFGMTWNNYGKSGWEVDHIIPDCNFKYQSCLDEEFKACWAIDNLQPLWSKDNKIKNGKVK